MSASDPVAPLAAATTSAGGELHWLVPELVTLPLAPRRCVVRNAATGATLELSSGEHTVLSACEGCRTLAEHTVEAAEKLAAPPAHHSAIRELLERCARAGLLVSLPDLARRFGASGTAVPLTLAAVVIRTADRPQPLARLLASAETLESRCGSRRRWVVVDDSHSLENERANRAAIEACRALEVEHVDHASSGALEKELRDEFPSYSHEIAWLLGRGAADDATPGRPLNHALLRMAGRAFLAVDDDALLEPRRPPLSEAGFAVSDEPDELLWYESENALWSACPELALDPISAHEQWLGLPMADAWARAGQQAGEPAVLRVSAAQLGRFDAAARILFTQNHVCGDPGSSELPIPLLSLPDCSRRWLAANPQAAAYAFGPRINWRGQARLRLAPQRPLTFTTMAGIDNSRLLPPTTRNGRSTDILLGTAAQWMYPTSWVVDLPFGLPHRRAKARHWLASAETFIQEPLHVVFSYLDERAPRIVAESAADRLAAMAGLLLDFAAASDRKITEMLLQHAADAGSRALFAIQSQLDSAALPAAWKAALAPWLSSPALAVDADALRRRVLDPAGVRALLRAYGNAMRAWPRLWEFCRERQR